MACQLTITPTIIINSWASEVTIEWEIVFYPPPPLIPVPGLYNLIKPPVTTGGDSPTIGHWIAE